MSRKEKLVFRRTDVWREGQWLDLWSIVHLFSGFAIGIGFALSPFDFIFSTVLAFLGFSAYEAWEAFVEIEETTANRFMDIVIGMAGFLSTYFLLASFLTLEALIVSFIITASVASILSFFGWRASQKAASLKVRLRERREARRERR